MPSTRRSEATLARSLYHQVVGMGKGESILRRDSPLKIALITEASYPSPRPPPRERRGGVVG